MKTTFVLFAAATLSTQAALIQFALSPPGTEAAVGLSWQNEIPPPTNSVGTGNTVGGGIVFNTDTSILHVEVGYGSAAGFSDLTGVPTGMHIHSAAPVGSNAPVLIDLMPYNIATNPPKGGFILGDIAYPSNSVANLLAGLNYLNIHTTLNPGGEIRGQLIPLAAPTNLPPSITCATNSTAECGTASTVTVIVSDPNNDSLTVVWNLNGANVQTNTLAAGATSTPANVSYSNVLGLGTNVLAVTVSDSVGNSAACASTVTVVDTTPPVIVSVEANPHSIWPPNHKMVSVRVQAHVTDTCGSATWKVISISSNEGGNAKGNGHTAPDWKITGDHTLKVRAERAGGGSGRVYTITIQATDLAGNTALGTVTVTVPHDHSTKQPPHGNQGDKGDKGDEGNHGDKGNSGKSGSPAKKK